MKIVMKEYLFTLVCLLLSWSVFASPSSKKHEPMNYKNEVPMVWVDPNHFEVIGAVGIAQIYAGNSHLGITSSETDELVQTNENSWNTWVGQVGAGYVFYLPNRQRFSPNTQWFPSVEPELNFYYSANEVNGDVYRFNDPAFNELSYKSSIDTSRLMLDAALTIVSKDAFSLFVIGGIGNAWSNVDYYDNVKGSIPCDLSALNLSDRDQSNFVWEIGAGVAYAFNERTNLSLEYLYTDFGSLELPDTIDTTSLTAPVITASSFDFHTQAVLLGLHIGLS